MLEQKVFQKFFLKRVCLCIYVCMHVCLYTRRGHQSPWDYSYRQLWTSMFHVHAGNWTQDLGRSSSDLYHWAISPAQWNLTIKKAKLFFGGGDDCIGFTGQAYEYKYKIWNSTHCNYTQRPTGFYLRVIGFLRFFWTDTARWQMIGKALDLQALWPGFMTLTWILSSSCLWSLSLSPRSSHSYRLWSCVLALRFQSGMLSLGLRG